MRYPFTKLQVCLSAAAHADCIALHKGAETGIAQPRGSAGLHSATADQATSWFVIAGVGDVFADFISGVLARDVRVN
ncbi:MAG: hypothetical protein ABJ360_27060 [Roseobacter sp.]